MKKASFMLVCMILCLMRAYALTGMEIGDTSTALTFSTLPHLHTFLEKKEYRMYERPDLEKFVKSILENKIDINHSWKNQAPAHLSEDGIDNTMIDHKATMLGCCLCRDRYDMSGAVLADILVTNGARLSGSYDDKFGFYFVKRGLASFMLSCDLRTPTTKLFEVLLYRRVQYCVQQTRYVYLIAQRIKKKRLYPQLSFALPKFVVDHITHFIVKDGVTDVMNVCDEEAAEWYDRYREDKKDWTMRSFWQSISQNKDFLPPWTPELKLSNAQKWQKDFDDFIQKKRNNEWKSENQDKNVILRSLRYKTGSLYKDEEFFPTR